MNARNANEQLVLDFFATLSSGDLEVLRGFFTEESVWKPMVTDIPGSGAHKGNAIIDEFLAPVRGLFVDGDLKMRIGTLLSEGDTVVCETTGRGELQDGRIYENSYCWVFVVRDGKLLHIREYMDSHYVARIFGMASVE